MENDIVIYIIKALMAFFCVWLMYTIALNIYRFFFKPTNTAFNIANRQSEMELEKLAQPTNAILNTLFENVDSIIFKRGGVYKDKALTHDIVFSITQSEKIKEFQSLLEINELNTGSYCMCLGNYAIELNANHQTMTTIGFHHGVSIRYSRWNSDAELAKSDELLRFLFNQGLTKPFEEM